MTERGEVLLAYAESDRRRGLTESSVRSRIQTVQRWWNFVGDPWKATRRDVEAFIDPNRLRAARSRYATVSHLHRFYRWARREGLCRRDPTEFVDRPRLIPALPRPIHDTDLAVALTLATPQLQAAILLAATSGLRCVELARLRWADVTDDAVRVTGKGGRDRVVPLHPFGRAALDTLDRADDFVLPWRATTTDDSPGRRVSMAINRYFHSLGITATAHQLRHYCATKALTATKDLRAVQELLGHASPATTAVYTRLDPSHLRAAVDGITIDGFVPG